VSRLLRRLVASIPRFRSGFDSVHLLIDELRDFEDFDDQEITALWEFISTRNPAKLSQLRPFNN
jgi:hypothetical protein